MPTSTTTGRAPRTHLAMVCDDDGAVVACARAWTEQGIARGDRVVAVLTGATASAVAARLSPAADGVAFLSAEALGRRVGVGYRRLAALLEGAPGDGALRVVVERPETRPVTMLPGELRERITCDALFTEPLEARGGTCMCLYRRADLGEGDDDWIREAHPDTAGPGGVHTDAAGLASRAQSQVGDYATPDTADVLTVTHADDLRRVRGAVADVLGGVAAGDEEAEDFLVAVSEIATNALIHGGVGATVTPWVDEGRVVCDVRDRGPGFADPLTGYRVPGVDARSGRGLWLARQLTTLVEVGRAPDGTLVRLHLSPER
jgi:anti-sigma regulatory factor (Ser/Thr protein kinase)